MSVISGVGILSDNENTVSNAIASTAKHKPSPHVSVNDFRGASTVFAVVERMESLRSHAICLQFPRIHPAPRSPQPCTSSSVLSGSVVGGGNR